MGDLLLMQYLIFGSLILFSLLSVKLIKFLKKRKNNVPLWATVFEGMTMGLVDLGMYKEPETSIEKKARRDGRDNSPPKFIDPSSLLKSERTDT